jgi:5-methylcytosine-specific restriction protein A
MAARLNRTSRRSFDFEGRVVARATEEWAGKQDDAAIPPRVKDRIFRRCGGVCVECRRPLNEREKPQFDHITALINGGQHAEFNLQTLCGPCHKLKTKADVAEKSDVYQSRAKSLGFFAPKRAIQSQGFLEPEPQRSASRKPLKFVGMFNTASE